MSKRGFCVGPIIDVSFSPFYEVMNTRLISWVMFLLQNGRLKAIALQPPCATFSPAAWPSVRSYACLRGYNQRNPKTYVGNRLAFHRMALLLVALYAEVLALLETPRRSKMAWLKEWLYLLTLAGVREVSAASCAFGSIRQKEFRFLTANMDPTSVSRRCTRDHPHVKIEGCLTKGTAVYCPGLVQALADLFQSHLEKQQKAADAVDLQTDGLEEALVNEAIRCESWYCGSNWKWTGRSHINILELASYFQAVKDAARKGGGRFSFLVDSAVALFASSKGRSSSKALAPLLRKITATAVAFGVFCSNHFVPTRLNVSDDPTRSAPVREAVPHQPFDFPGLSSETWRRRQATLSCSLHQVVLDFDSTLGYPGEGPSLFWNPPWIFLFFLFLSSFLCSAGARHGRSLQPRNAEDVARAAKRNLGALDTGRPVQPITKTNS